MSEPVTSVIKGLSDSSGDLNKRRWFITVNSNPFQGLSGLHAQSNRPYYKLVASWFQQDPTARTRHPVFCILHIPTDSSRTPIEWDLVGSSRAPCSIQQTPTTPQVGSRLTQTNSNRRKNKRPFACCLFGQIPTDCHWCWIGLDWARLGLVRTVKFWPLCFKEVKKIDTADFWMPERIWTGRKLIGRQQKMVGFIPQTHFKLPSCYSSVRIMHLLHLWLKSLTGYLYCNVQEAVNATDWDHGQRI